VGRKCPESGPESGQKVVPKVDRKLAESGQKVVRKWTRKCAENGPESEQKVIPKVDRTWSRKWPESGPESGQKMNRKWSESGPKVVPKVFRKCARNHFGGPTGGPGVDLLGGVSLFIPLAEPPLEVHPRTTCWPPPNDCGATF
jgi:hypothetical protein